MKKRITIPQKRELVFKVLPIVTDCCVAADRPARTAAPVAVRVRTCTLFPLSPP